MSGRGGKRVEGKRGREALGEVPEQLSCCLGKFGEGSSKRHVAAKAPGCCKQMGRGQGGDRFTLSASPIHPGWVARSLLLAPLTSLKLAKLAVCQAWSGPARAGGRVSGKGGFQELRRAGQAHQRHPEGGRQPGKRMCNYKDEGNGTGRQTDRQAGRPHMKKIPKLSVSSMPCASIQRVEEKPPLPSASLSASSQT